MKFLLQVQNLVRLFCLGLMFALAGFQASAQAVSGIVTDAANNEPLIGVNVTLKGTTKGTVTDINGAFELAVDDVNTGILVFSFVGYLPQEVALTGTRQVSVGLVEDAVGLSEVTVTALGISREKKSLGYAVQEVGGDDLDKAKDANLINNLAGKVAGVQIVGNPSGVGASARVTIRGERSLNINANQPLFVIDGVPISNGFSGSSGRNNQEVDYGNGAGFVNPDDIASVTVLKGAGATALYGSRGSNGVVLITTKSGKNVKGIGVSVNSTVMFENALVLPEYQNVYGQGLNGNFKFVDGNGGGTADGVDESWGPAFNGQLIEQFDGSTANGFRGGDIGNVFTSISPVNLPAQLAARGAITPTPWNAQPDNVKNFFETGVLQSHNFAVAGSNDRGDFRLSYTYLDQTGIVPNTGLTRNTLSFSNSYKISDKLTARSVVNYINGQSDNRPNLSYGTENIMYLFNCWLGRSVDLENLQEYWQRGRVGLNQFNYNYNYHDNPYFQLNENTNGQSLNRVFGYTSLTYQFNENLSLMLRGATDASDEFRERRRAYSTQRFKNGSYREEKVRLQETNLDALLSYNKDLNSDFNLAATLGGNLRKETINQSDISASELAVPDVYTLGNSRVALLSSTYRSEKRVNSLYGSAQLGFRNFLYLDLSGRNDWSSTLPADNWSYFYYAVSASAVLSEIIDLSATPISFLKLRGSVAQVGNDTDPFRLLNVYNATTAAKGTPAYSESSTLNNANLKPEISTSTEVGLDVRLWNNRLGLDAAYYVTNSENQILPQELSITTGYSSRIVNAGLIQNQGVEVALNITPVKTKDFTWDANFNFSANRSEVKELFKDPITGKEVTSYVIASRYMSVEARIGERMGDMYAIGFQRVSSDSTSAYYDATGEHVGEIVFSSTGKPIATTERIKLGNYNPDFLLGIGNTFNYKGIGLSVLFDIRKGGEVYSHTQTVGREGGQIIETLEGREEGYYTGSDPLLLDAEEGTYYIGQGVVQNADGTFSDNTRKLSAREWHTSITLGRRLLEAMVYDASFVKLREVRLGYTIPNKLLGKAPISDISISFVGRNLALWTKVPHIDPETSSTSGGTIIPGVESVALPSTRSFGFNLNLKF